MFIIKLALVIAPLALIGLSALPKILIQRRDRRDIVEAVEEFRSTHPIDDTDTVIITDPDEVDLDAKWGAYWSNARAEENALRADLNDYVGWAAALEDRFTLDCNRIIKQFTIDALILQAESASRRGGWTSDLDRRSDVIIENSDHSISKLNHELKVEVAECTATGSWNEETERELIELLTAEGVRS